MWMLKDRKMRMIYLTADGIYSITASKLLYRSVSVSVAWLKECPALPKQYHFHRLSAKGRRLHNGGMTILCPHPSANTINATDSAK